MAHFALCSRPDIAPAAPSTVNTAMRSPQTESFKPDGSLKEEFGTSDRPRRQKHSRKARKFVPLDLETIESKPQVSAADSTSIAHQPPNPNRNARSKARGEAVVIVPAQHSRPTVPARSTPIRSVHDSTTKKPRRGRKLNDMVTPPPSAYIPPHVRKRAAAPAQIKTDVKLGDSIDIKSPPTSVKSRGEDPLPSQVHLTEPFAQKKAPLSPPTTVEKPTETGGEYSGWDEPRQEPSAAPPKQNTNSRWPRASKPPKERHVWLKLRDIPKGPSSGSQSDGGVVLKSDSEGDPSYDVKKLMSWNGDWLPPPEEWTARKGFTNRHFGQVIEQWANEHSRNCIKPMQIDSPSFLGVEDADGKWENKELVPRYWLHDSIDGDATRKFWEELPHRAPLALSDIDITLDPPYWERWEDDHDDGCFMATLAVPEARINLSNPSNELKSPYAMLCTAERLARINEIKADKERRLQARRRKPVSASAHNAPQMPDRRLQPKANIYLRPVQPADVRGIMTIYNHYVLNTVHAHELEERTEAYIRGRIDDTIQDGLPFLVAVAKRNQRKGQQGYVTETIVGYTHLESYESGMFLYTFDLELYVHPGYIRQGVGKCLLDQIMYMANTGYNAKGGYEWVNEFEYLKNGKSRVVKTIISSVYYERGDDVEWATSYLGEFGFIKAGRFAQVGHKNGKVVDKVMFQLQTTEVIDPNSIPTVQG